MSTSGSYVHTSGRVLVTGATGFLGRRLCKGLLDRGFFVRATYRNSIPSGSCPPNLEWWKSGDLNPETDWSEALQGIDFVVHAAALAHQIGSDGEGRAAEFMRMNRDVTRQLAEQASRAPGLRRFIYISSISASGADATGVLSERSPDCPSNDYGRSKLAGEKVVIETLDYTPDWCILRPTLVYGPGNPGNMKRLLRLIQSGAPLPFGSIRNRRSFVFVDNLVDAIARALIHPAASRKMYLVSDGEDVSTPALVSAIASQAGLKARLFPFPVAGLQVLGLLGDTTERLLRVRTGLDTYSVSRLVGSLSVDSSAIRRDLDWTPPFSVQAGLRITLEGDDGNAS